MKLKRLVSILCAQALAASVVASAYANAVTAESFSDIDSSDYFYSAVEWGTENGIVEGVEDDRFEPTGKVTRAQAVTFLWRMNGMPETETELTFSDVEKDSWYEDAVNWAVASGITDGTNEGEFSPYEICDRAMCLTLLYRLEGSTFDEIDAMEPIDPERDIDFENLGNLFVQQLIAAFRDGQGFIDVHNGDYYELPVIWGALSSIITEDNSPEFENRLFHPNDSCTRAEMVSFLYQTKLYEDAANENGDITWFDNYLSLWNDDAESKNALTSYMDAITDFESEDYIPVEDRIAVFDLDGTLFCETDPNYFDYCLLKYRVLDDPTYKDKASEFEREVALKIKEQNETGASFSGLEVDHGKAVASAFKGMTVGEFNDYIQEFKKQPMPSYEGMTRGGGFYLPMLEVIDYLRANDFDVYVVSGTDRFIVRGIVYDSPLYMPAGNVIGSDETLVATGQGDTDGLNYVFTDKDKLVLGGDFIVKNLKMNKVSVIMQEIGKQPVLSFGNSTGDASMAEYVTTGNKYKSLAFMLCCDDTERENGNISKAESMQKLCAEYDWVPISMKNDWTTIYGDDVKKK